MTCARGLGWSLLALALGCGATKAASDTGPPDRSLEPAVRRLSTAELDATVQTLLGSRTTLAAALPPDARQSDYSRNVAQSVDSLLLGQLFDATRSATNTL